jgi:hypothetical protein
LAFKHRFCRCFLLWEKGKLRYGEALNFREFNFWLAAFFAMPPYR